jgi:hypothetical protein
MKQFPFPPAFDGTKFAQRYGLSEFSFWVQDNVLHFPDSVPDSPIFDPLDPVPPQAKLVWEASDIPGAARLVAKFNNKTSAIVGAVGADASTAAMYQSPGPVGPQPAGPRREFHIATLADLPSIPVTTADGDTLYVVGDGEYRFSNGAWRRILFGPTLGSPGDTPPLYVALNTAIDDVLNDPGVAVNGTKLKAILAEWRKLI